jgi:hypothetical protein
LTGSPTSPKRETSALLGSLDFEEEKQALLNDHANMGDACIHNGTFQSSKNTSRGSYYTSSQSDDLDV